MEVSIKTIEDLSLNAWPSHQMQVYDGWILRFSHFYTHRTNCIEPIGASVLPLAEKVAFCEAIYRHWKSPCIFKISPIADPDLDAMLFRRGYCIEHEVDVMVASLKGNISICPAKLPGLLVKDRVDNDWLDGLFRLKRMADPVHHRIVPAMYAAIPMDEIVVSVERDGHVVGTGLGILDRGYVGVYAIHVGEGYRRQGLARKIVSMILAEGQRRGASMAYLQVVSENGPAKGLYRSLGFYKAYSCYFRVNECEDNDCSFCEKMV
ncbi:MAG: GNAT family N-acetyltransferase [bacterium]